MERFCGSGFLFLSNRTKFVNPREKKKTKNKLAYHIFSKKNLKKIVKFYEISFFFKNKF